MSLRTGWQRLKQRGNAVLFSLLIMGSALTASLGMATLVVGEIHTVALIPPSERAYYKAESYVEQALWEKKRQPTYQKTDYADNKLPSGYLCAGQCFATEPVLQDELLSDFEATTSLTEEKLRLKQDQTTQIDIDTQSAAGATGTFSLGDIESLAELRGVEVSIIAFPRNPSDNRYPNDDPDTAQDESVTPVFVEKRLFKAGTRAEDTIIQLGTGNFNSLPQLSKEEFPPLNDSVYRVRLKALGASTTVEPQAVADPSKELAMFTPDFRVLAVAQDGPARRGIEVLIPAAEKIVDVFDFVIFSDLALDKTQGKAPRKPAFEITVIKDTDLDCVKDAGEVGRPDVTVRAERPGFTRQAVSGSDGTVSFGNLEDGTYDISLVNPPPAGEIFCPPTTSRETVTSGEPTRRVTFLVRPRRLGIYLWFYNYGYHGGAYDYDYYHTAATSVANYTNLSGGPYWYIYPYQVPGASFILWEQNIGGFGARTYRVNGFFYAPNLVGWFPGNYNSCPSGSTLLLSLRHPQVVGNILALAGAQANSWNRGGWQVASYFGCAWTTP